MDATSTLTGAAKGAAAGMALGPIGAGVGALLGAAPGLLDMLGIHLFGDNGEAVASAALNVVRTVTGKPDPTGGDLAGLPPEQMAQVRVQLAQIAAGERAAERQADADAQKAAMAAQVASQAAAYADTASARGQTVSLAQAGSMAAWGAPVVSLVVLCLFGVGYWQVFHMPPGDASAVQIGMVEILKAAVIGVVGYWVGSSAGSTRKDELLHASVPAK